MLGFYEENQSRTPEQLAPHIDFTDGRGTILCERHQNHNKAKKGSGFEFGREYYKQSSTDNSTGE